MLSPPCGLGPRQGLAFFSWVSGNSLESWDTARSGWRLSCTQSANPNPPRLSPVLPASDWRMIHGWDTICALEEAGKPGKQTALHGETWDRPVPASRHGAVTISEGQTDKLADPQTDHVLASMEDGHAGRQCAGRDRWTQTDRHRQALRPEDSLPDTQCVFQALPGQRGRRLGRGCSHRVMHRGWTRQVSLNRGEKRGSWAQSQNREAPAASFPKDGFHPGRRPEPRGSLRTASGSVRSRAGNRLPGWSGAALRPQVTCPQACPSP